jgi:serine/threonine protein phosphatase PrpC
MIDITYTQHCGRNPGQQDALWTGEQIFQDRDLPVESKSIGNVRSLVVAVADGVASSPFPQKASRICLELLAEEVSRGSTLTTPMIRRVHGRLCDVLAKGRTFGSSTTLAAVQCTDNHCVSASVGDSRVYRISALGEWQQISRDHTILNALLDSGEADSDKEYASFYGGLDACLVADDEGVEFPVCRVEVELLPGDSILVCTDGVHDTLGDENLRKLTKHPMDPAVQVDRWRKAILKLGAPDNFSMALLRHRI